MALIEEVRRIAPFCLVTARSREEVLALPPIPHDALIGENGCVIYEAEELDAEWDALMAPAQPVLDRVWRDAGLVVERKLRGFAFHLSRNGFGDAEVAELQRRLPAELTSRFSTNDRGRFLEVFPAVGGKDRAVQRVAARYGVGLADTAAMGDDTNDLDMLGVCGFPLTNAEGKPAVQELVRARGGYVSPSAGHAAAQDLLRRVLEWVGRAGGDLCPAPP